MTAQLDLMHHLDECPYCGQSDQQSRDAHVRLGRLDLRVPATDLGRCITQDVRLAWVDQRARADLRYHRSPYIDALRTHDVLWSILEAKRVGLSDALIQTTITNARRAGDTA